MIHSFHIPVMGLAYTIDTPIKVAHLGISSVVSISDDYLVEKVRDFYASKYSISVPSINRKDKEARVTIIQSFLNLTNTIVNNNWTEHIRHLIDDKEYRKNFISQLPNSDFWEKEWQNHENILSITDLIEWVKKQFKPGKIDVNIMTKLDKKNYREGNILPIEYNDAHAGMRGFAQSDLNSSIVLSAGMNLPLFAYMQNFKDFYPNSNGSFNKKITIKVSDYRSALVQGKMLAKKGLWVSEFRIESGLNCGGHTFPTQGNLIGPILEEFKVKREELYNELYSLWESTLIKDNKTIGNNKPSIKITAQGGVGTHVEHEFLLNYYGMNSVGWGSPFMLVPEAVCIDNDTLQRLIVAKEEDLYLSNASPIGIPFNNLRNSTRQQYQQKRVAMGTPGSPCTKKFLQLNTDFGEKPICASSVEYIKIATEKLEQRGLSEIELSVEKEKLYEKECLCCGLSLPFWEVHEIVKPFGDEGVTVCPGPNIAYFDKEFSLNDMILHIYGKKNLITRTDRPNMFVKEIQLYMDYLEEKFSSYITDQTDNIKNYLKQYIKNLISGIQYYKVLFEEEKATLQLNTNAQSELDEFIKSLMVYESKL